jgi:hypothetical protein
MMSRSTFASGLAFASLLSACDPNIRIGSLGGTGMPASQVPAQLPARMLIGLADDSGTWMGASGVAWDVRWTYFTSSPGTGTGWYNGYASGGLSTDWAVAWLQGAANQNFIPGVQYYLLEPDYAPSGNAGAQILSARLQVPSVMKDYFGKWKLFLQAAKQVARPVVVILEGNALGAIEVQANNDPSTYAAIADSGLPELAGLPNTVAGFGLAFLALRQSVGASNVVLGPDIEQSAAQGDFLNHAASDDVAPHVDYQYGGFLSHLGLAANQTGETFDFVAACPSYADADQYAAQGDAGFWWDASDSAPISTSSFNRYAEWLTRFNQASKLPWILWQVPMGNSNSPNVDNKEGAWAGPYPSGYVLPAGCAQSSTAGCPGGYKDNRAEYFLGEARAQHLAKFAAAGVIGILFGANTAASDQTDDYYGDGQLFLKSRAGALLAAGGFPLAR